MKTLKELYEIDRALHSKGEPRDWVISEAVRAAMVRLAQRAALDGLDDAQDIESAAYRAALGNKEESST